MSSLNFPSDVHLGIEPIVFTKAETDVPGMSFEYRVDESRLQFHVWPAEGMFPNWAAKALAEGLSSVPEDRKTVEYVPEVESWYVEIRYELSGPSPSIVEAIIGKIGRAAMKYV